MKTNFEHSVYPDSRGLHYTYFGYGDVPLGRVSIFKIMVLRTENGINFHNFGVRNGTDLQDFAMKYKFRYTFSKNWYKFGYTFSKNWYKERVCF